MPSSSSGLAPLLSSPSAWTPLARPTQTNRIVAIVQRMSANEVKRVGENYCAFLCKFDLSSLPEDTQILKAVVGFSIWDGDSKDTSVMGTYRMQQDWVEAEACWDSPQSSLAWSTGHFAVGSDTLAKPEMTIEVLSDQGTDLADPPLRYEMDITQMVKEWVGLPAQNYGLAWVPMSVPSVDAGEDIRVQIVAAERLSWLTSTPRLVIYTPQAVFTGTLIILRGE